MARRSAGTRRAGRGRPGLLLLQTSQHIGPWRNNRPGGWLANQTRTRWTRRNRRTGCQISRPGGRRRPWHGRTRHSRRGRSRARQHHVGRRYGDGAPRLGWPRNRWRGLGWRSARRSRQRRAGGTLRHRGGATLQIGRERLSGTCRRQTRGRQTRTNRWNRPRRYRHISVRHSRPGLRSGSQWRMDCTAGMNRRSQRLKRPGPFRLNRRGTGRNTRVSQGPFRLFLFPARTPKRLTQRQLNGSGRLRRLRHSGGWHGTF
jgi:hypothetical protein